ncbi:MAG: hypothetical protein HZA28_06185 [Candidatus Omnitrophica bacterium]|nr:hypothetical protein [Candidatus Omnitrophota bacterium]
MAFLRDNLWLLFIFLPRLAEACPACLVSNNGRFLNQTLVAVAVMWLLPVLLAGVIGFQIYRLCRREK